MRSNGWERVNDDTYRMKTPNGWLVKCVVKERHVSGEVSIGISLTTVDDLNHIWKINGERKKINYE